MSTGTGTIDIARLGGGRVNLTHEQLDELDSPLKGPLLPAGDEGWGDAVLVWNGMVAMVPALVVQPTSTHDAAAAVGFARGLLLSIKRGATTTLPNPIAEGGLTLDMSRLHEVTVGAQTKLAG